MARHRSGVGRTRGTSPDQIAVLVVRDRSGETANFRLEKLDAPHVIAVLRPLIAPDALLCTDGANVYKTFARVTGVAYRTLNVQQGIRVIEGVFHIQNVNAYDSRGKRAYAASTASQPNTSTTIWAGAASSDAIARQHLPMPQRNRRPLERQQLTQTEPFVGALLRYAENDEPHPQVDVALGFLITNCDPSSPSV